MAALKGLYDGGASTGRRKLDAGCALSAQTTIFNDDGGARAAVGSTGTTTSFHQDVKTLYEALRHGAKQGEATRDCLGYRKDGVWTWLSWEDVLNQSQAIAHGLPGARGGEGESMPQVGVLSDNCPEATLVDHAITIHSRVSVHMHTDWTIDTLASVINKLGLKVVVCDTNDRLTKLLSLASKCKDLKELVVMESEIRADLAPLAEAAHIKLSTLEQVEEVGDNPPHWHTPPKPTDPVSVIFSRDPVRPKAILLTHANLMSNLAGMKFLNNVNIGPADTFYTGQSLAHVSQRVLEGTAMILGCKMLYGARGEAPEEVCASGKPTIVHLAPRTVSTLRRKGLAMPGVEAALRAKEADLAQSVVTNAGPSDAALAPIRAMLGGQVKIVLTCMEPLNWSMLKFLRLGLGCPVSEGYLMAEVGGVVCAQNPADLMAVGNVGTPGPGLRVKLRDVPEFGLRAAIGAGEVMVRGPSVSPGYLKDPALQAVSYQGGWFATGDVGMWRPNGTLKLLGRKAEMWKMGTGELVDPTRLEAVFRRSELVESVMVVAGPGGAIGALVVPVAQGTNQNQVITEWQREGQMEGLAPSMIPKSVAFVPNFTPLHPSKTPWPRLNRMSIVTAFQPTIRSLFAFS